MDIVLRESKRLNDTIRNFLTYARPQRGGRRAARPRPRSSPTPPCCCGNSGDVQAGTTRSRRTSPPSPCGSRPTKGRSGRSCGTWRPTACARCRRAAAFAWPSGPAATPAPAGGPGARPALAERVHRGAGRRRRHRARGPRRHLPAVPRHVRARQRPRPRHRPPHRVRLRRGDPGRRRRSGRGRRSRCGWERRRGSAAD